MAQNFVEAGRTPFNMWCKAHLVPVAEATPASRSGTKSQGFDASEFRLANLLVVEFTDGSVLFTQPASFAAHYGRDATRSGEGNGSRVNLPFALRPAWTAHSRGGGDGDGGGIAAVERYRLERLIEPTTLDLLYDMGAQVDAVIKRLLGSNPPSAARLALKICAAFEASMLARDERGQAGGLLEWSSAGRWAFRDPERAWPAYGAAGRAPAFLLFLHGTASSTDGSFGRLWTAPGKNGDETVSADFKVACRSYAGVLAYEHRSLTRSPIENTIDLLHRLMALPVGAQIDLVSHSRGGLVGDLLAMVTLTEPELARARQAFDSAFAPIEKQKHPDIESLDELFGLLSLVAARSITVRTFVRVACPARGTLLADRRTDLFLSLLVRAVGLAFGTNGVPAYEMFAGLASALVAARADAKSLPGLQAMIPGSELTRALNLYGLTSNDRLRVIAGDVQAKGLSGVLTLLGDVFYGLHDHDFVVHTRSMFGGLERRATVPLSLRVESAAISHFSYFGDAESRAALFTALSGGDQGFSNLADDESHTRGLTQMLVREPLCRYERSVWLRKMRDPDTQRMPVLLVLPGIMGSELTTRPDAGGKRIWLQPAAVFAGQATWLEFTEPPGLLASGLIPAAYERLLRRMTNDFRVVTCPFDWRQPIQQSATELVSLLDAIDQAIGDRTFPLHLLAHSMGGLVARWAFFHTDAGAQKWASLRDRGGRLLMLGTPNKGSYAPVRAMLRQHPICNLIAGLSPGVSASKVAGWTSAYPGLLQMLPASPDSEYGALTASDTWNRIVKEDPAAQRPSDVALAEVIDFQQALASRWDEVRADPHVLYVAGQGLTDVAMDSPGAKAINLDEGLARIEHITLRQAWHGDGTVGYDSTLDAARTWYVQAEHGSLADTPSAFDGYVELLRTGSTSKFRKIKPSPRGSLRASAAAPRSMAQLLEPPSLPDEVDAATWVLGLTPAGAVQSGMPDKIDVRVVFGSLDYARFPLLVGHYLNDRIVSAEKRVDEKLAGQLQQLHDLNLYPGALKTSAYVRPNCRDDAPPAYPGAIVVGLGNVGEFTPTTLAETVARGVLRYAFEHRYRDPFVPQEMPEDIRLSALLIGSHSQAVSLRESMLGVLQGMWRASTVLAQTPQLKDLVRIREVEIIEMWEHRALEAAYSLQQLLARPEWSKHFHWDRPLLEERDGGLSGYAIKSNKDWWQRLIVRQDDLGGMSYALIAEKARVEATQVQSDIAGMSSFMEAVADGSTQSTFDDPQMSRVLYEMLLPNDLKSRLANFDDTVLVVDEHSACYPWELMAPPRPVDDTTEDEQKPLVVQAGMIRQRLTEDFRRLPQVTAEFNVLIIGAPCTDGWKDDAGKHLEFVELEGAKREASRVEALLRNDPRDWQMTSLIGKSCMFDEIRLELLAKPYRVLHLSGHGVVNQWLRTLDVAGIPMPVRKTGMVLSRQQLLGAADIEQMSSVPELVFINCCYSGREGDALGPAARRYPMLAASMALQFIRMGAKAVVAAGWRVDDDAAELFAERFYAEILTPGRSFGEAVRAARESVFAEFRDRTNTWGAYQCYGDPEWRLEGRQRSSSNFSGTSRLLHASQTMSHRELASRVNQVIAISGDKPQAALLQQLNELVDELRRDPLRESWLRSTTVCTSLGEAYREVGDHASAVEWFQAAAAGAYSQLQLRHVELLANSLSRNADPFDRGSMQPATNADLSRAAIDWLAAAPGAVNGRGLNGLKTPGTAESEHESIRGSIALREAVLLEEALADDAPPETMAALTESLETASRHFARAYAAKARLNDYTDRQAFALSNFLLTASLATLCKATDREAQPAILKALLRPLHEEVEAVLAAIGEMASDGRQQRRGDEPRMSGVQWLHAADMLIQRLRDDNPRTFWDYTNRLDLSVARCIFNEMLRPKPPVRGTLAPLAVLKEADQLLEGALIRWPSPREIESMKTRFELITNVLSRRPGDFHETKGRVILAFAERTLARLYEHRPNAG